MKKLLQIFFGLGLALAFRANVLAQTVTIQPQSLTVNNASTALFTVGASGVTNYQWQFQGSNIAGATASALTLENVNTNQAGNYAVVLNGSVTSSNAQLTVLPGTIVTFVLSGFPGGGTSNIDVQLFDHDKPATVQNFIHYIRAGGFTNLFFDRCYPGFVLQAGDYGATDRTNTSPPITGWNITSQFTRGSNQPNPPYPDHIDSEFNLGPVNHNIFGTIAMALGDLPNSQSTDTNSARGAFFFNLTDNSFLDSGQDMFTVFGRVLDATNVLQYFSQVSDGQGATSLGEISLNGELQPIPGIGDASLLPIDYIGTNVPANANLVFCDFANIASLPVDTNPPTIAITSPVNELLTNSLQGIAGDDIGLALVMCVVTPQIAADGTYPSPFTNASPQTVYAAGTTNWSLSLNPGIYSIGAQSQDGAGNLSAITNIQVTNTAVVIVGDGTAIVTNVGATNVNAVGYPFQDNAGYDILAIPGTNQLFVNWTVGPSTVVTPQVNFTMQSGAVFTATFISNGLPNSVAFTSPTADEVVTNLIMEISGTISNVPSPPVTVTSQIYSVTAYDAVGPPLVAVGTTNWSVLVTNLADGSYTVQATAVDSAGNTTVITQNFTVSVIPEILSQPQSLTVNAASTAIFTVGATNGLSYQWQFNGTNLGNGGNISGATSSALTLDDVNTDQAGNYSVIVNSATLSVTSSPPATLTVLPGTVVTFIFTGMTNGSSSNVVDVQLFDHDKPATVQNFLHYLRAGAFTNMFFDECNPNLYLQCGNYGASNQTDTTPPISGWDIYSAFTADGTQTPPLPHLLASELTNTTVIPINFGTLAMGVVGRDPTSASSFFFNLGDNGSRYSSFDVFGRILDGTNVLKYFNALGTQFGLTGNGEFLDKGTLESNQPFAHLPVNYNGTNPPANADLIFVGIQFPTNFVADTNPPTVTITTPAPGALFSNGFFTVQGTAADDVGLADVVCVLIPQAAVDGTLPNRGVPITNYTIGTSNWSMVFTNANDPYRLVPPGHYLLSVQSQDGAGNLSTASMQPLIMTAIVTNGGGSVTVSNGAFTNIDAVGYPFQIGSNYNLTETPVTNWSFVSWIGGGTELNMTNVPFLMQDGILISANFVLDNFLNAIAFTYPETNGAVFTNAFNISGTISGELTPPVTITCQIYSIKNNSTFGGPLTAIGTTNWTEPATNLPVGPYFVQATAVDSLGNRTVISEDFTVSTPAALTLHIVGPGTVSGATNGQSILIGSIINLTATPNPGQLFGSWNYNGQQISLNPVQSYQMVSNLTLTATFVTNNISNFIAFTYPPANGIIGTNTFVISGTISNAPSATVTCQIFSNSIALGFTRPLVTAGISTWGIELSGLPVGSYTLVAVGVDPAGDSTQISENFSVAYSGQLRVVIVGDGTVAPVTNGETLSLGTNFQVTATPDAGHAFYSWNDGTQITTGAVQTFTMANNLTLTATFIPSNTAKGISFTYPPARGLLRTNDFQMKGLIAPSMKSAQITCQFFQTNGVAVGAPMMTSGTNNWAIDVTNLPGGIYFVEAQATNAAGKSTLVSEGFSIYPFSLVQGTYSGLFICTNHPVCPTNSGYVTFTVQANGIMTGKLEFPGYAMVPIYPLAIENIAFTTGFAELNTKSFHGASLLGTINFDLTSGTDIATGNISSTNWSSELLCYRAMTRLSTNTIPALGKYNLSLQPVDPTNGPFTNGHASLTVGRNGSILVSGALPDNTTFSESALVSRDGIWPLYAIPSGVKTNGMLLGWQYFTNSGNCNGQLYWYKAPHVGTYYTNGIGVNSNLELTVSGTNYVRPAANGLYTIIFSGGMLPAPLTNSLKVNTAGQFVVTGGAADKLKMSLSIAGVITGTILNTNNNKSLKFNGAFISPTIGGSGFIPDANGQTGIFDLQP